MVLPRVHAPGSTPQGPRQKCTPARFSVKPLAKFFEASLRFQQRNVAESPRIGRRQCTFWLGQASRRRFLEGGDPGGGGGAQFGETPHELRVEVVALDEVFDAERIATRGEA